MIVINTFKSGYSLIHHSLLMDRYKTILSNFKRWNIRRKGHLDYQEGWKQCPYVYYYTTTKLLQLYIITIYIYNTQKSYIITQQPYHYTTIIYYYTITIRYYTTTIYHYTTTVYTTDNYYTTTIYHYTTTVYTTYTITRIIQSSIIWNFYNTKGLYTVLSEALHINAITRPVSSSQYGVTPSKNMIQTTLRTLTPWRVLQFTTYPLY